MTADVTATARRPATRVAPQAPATAVALDVDGTLVDSVDAHARAWVAALAQFGMKVGFEDVRPLIGMGGDKLLPTVSGISSDSDVGKAISTRRSEIFRETELDGLRPMPGAHDLVEALRHRGLTLGVATSSKPDELRSLLEVVGAKWLLDDATDADDVSSTKPDPDVVHAALGRMGTSPSETVLLGDTRWDVEAGARAGVRVMAVRCGGSSDADLAGAIAIYDDPADILAHLESSPLRRRAREPSAP